MILISARPARSPLNCPRRAFTLIELLAVISVIAILAGLLLPTLSKAKGRGRSVACLNQQKQTGVAIDLYLQDYDYYPPGHQEPGGQWNYCLEPYVGNSVSSSNVHSRVFMCPSAKSLSGEMRLNFSANPNVCKEITDRSGPAPFDSIKRPVDTLVIADAIQYTPDGDSHATFWGVVGSAGKAVYFNDGLEADAGLAVGESSDSDSVLDSTNPQGSNFRFRHGKTANAWFADGHAASVRKGKILDRNLYTNY